MPNEYGKLRKVALRHARDAYQSQEHIDNWWQRLNYPEAVDFDEAVREYDTFAKIFQDRGVEITWLGSSSELTPDAIYVRDSAITTGGDLILVHMGKPDRRGEVEFLRNNVTPGVKVVGEIEAPGMLEGGDLVWFDDHHIAVADGYRSNKEAATQLRKLLGGEVDVSSIPLPHYLGPNDVFHLMSFLSPVDKDLAVVHSRLMPVPFRNWLLDQGIEFVEVPDEEFDTMGCNVLALAPRVCLIMDNNPETARRMEKAGCEVITYKGAEISAKGCGGPTCLSRPLVRD
jgi:N-dimethylarginine dimethylaminohydrolase